MARELVHVAMKGEANVTMFTFGNPSTNLAFYHRSKAATVLEQDNLLTRMESLTN